jgi:hypothetical protein
VRQDHRRLDAAASPATEETDMPAQDQIVDAVMARALQADAVRTHPLLAWIVTRDEAEYPGEFVARLVTDGPTLYGARDRAPGGAACPAADWCGPTASPRTRLR